MVVAPCEEGGAIIKDIVAMIPLIETERLTLRGHGADDFPASAALWGDARVTARISGRVFTPEECWARLLRYAGLWSLLGFGYWAVTRKSDGAFIGESGFANFHRAIPSPHARLPEIGWVIAPAHQRQGYASEAVAAITAWGDKKFGGSQTFCIIDPDHAASLRVAEKAGYHFAERTTYLDSPVVLYLR
ncbi:MAG: GNAT family N-acetyltransferase [Rhodospirillaceae bacterium]|nr:GNAT family N-acetyltransferase [Rhodospirillaceae bacterium]